jgi:acetoin utilization deacetylase AcuC-like enzyme
MKCFYAATHAAHAPVWYVADGCVRPCPEVPARAVAIARTLADAGMEVEDLEGVRGPDAWPALRGVHEAGYLDYLRTVHDLWSAEFGACDVLPDTFVPRGMRGVRRPTKPAAQAGYYCFDMAAPIGAETWAAALGSATCAVAAARTVLHGERSAYAVCRPPGHHAGTDYCGGFCFLNNVAIAAQFCLLEGKKRVAIVDVDYHHGNGTQDIFYARGDVLFVSIHAEPNTQYPYFWGHAEETGVDAGAGCNVNLPLPRGCGPVVWMEALDRALERVAAFGPEVLLVSLGVDTAAVDGIGDFNLEPDDFSEVGRRIAGLGLPTVFVQEGGYNVEQIGRSVLAVLRGFEG